MATPAQRTNTWTLDEWYDQAVAGTTGGYDTNVLSLYSWGYNGGGELGGNNKTKYSSPVQVGTNTNWSKIGAATEGSGMAIKNDGTLWTWGKSSYGVLGHNNTTQYSSPKQLPGTTWNEVAGQQQGMTAIKTDGTLWTWGQNSDGQLGQNEGNVNYTQRSSPTQVGTDTTWNKPVVSNSQSGGSIKTDGTLWIWGDNDDGRLGHNNETQYSSPVQLGSDTTWNQVYMGNSGITAATKTDGTLWSWGDGGMGVLGLNQPSNTKISSPTQIPGTIWRSVFCGRKSSFATKTDGTMWSWGYGNRSSNGLLGQNNAISYSSPVQIPGTTWSTNLGGSNFTTLGMKLN